MARMRFTKKRRKGGKKKKSFKKKGTMRPLRIGNRM